MSERTPARPTGATEEQIEAAVRRGIPETMDWEYSAGRTVLMSIRDAAALLVPPGYSIVPDDQEEVATELDRAADQIATLNESVYRINQRLDQLESAKPSPVTDSDPICKTCQHPRSQHHTLTGCVQKIPGDFGVTICRCKEFVPVAAPEPSPPIDPALFHIAEAARRIKAPGPRIGLEIVFLELQGRSVLDDVMDEMLAYGRTS